MSRNWDRIGESEEFKHVGGSRHQQHMQQYHEYLASAEAKGLFQTLRYANNIDFAKELEILDKVYNRNPIIMLMLATDASSGYLAREAVYRIPDEKIPEMICLAVSTEKTTILDSIINYPKSQRFIIDCIIEYDNDDLMKRYQDIINGIIFGSWDSICIKAIKNDSIRVFEFAINKINEELNLQDFFYYSKKYKAKKIYNYLTSLK